MARLEQVTNNFSRAIKELVRIRNHHPEFISEIIEPMADCYQQIGDESSNKEFENFLLGCLDEQPRASTLLKMIELVRKHDSDASAIALLSSRLRQNPSLKGVVAMLQLHISKAEGQLHHDLSQAVEILKLLLQSKPGYQCDQCGFETRSLYWQCSSCQNWDTVKPKLGIEGE
jgi:lipopolysaccharide biosynthesis regulator YciM